MTAVRTFMNAPIGRRDRRRSARGTARGKNPGRVRPAGWPAPARGFGSEHLAGCWYRSQWSSPADILERPGATALTQDDGAFHDVEFDIGFRADAEAVADLLGNCDLAAFSESHVVQYE